MDVLHDHNRIVNDQTDGDRQASHRHQIDRAAEDMEEHERGDDGQRQREGRNECQPHVPQKGDQHDEGEKSADQDRVPHVHDGGGHELPEVVHFRDAEPGGQRVGEVGERPLDARAQIQDVGANLLRDGQGNGFAAVTGDEERAVGGAGGDASQIGHANRCAFLDNDGRGRDLTHARPETRGKREMLLAGFGESPHRRQQVLTLQLLGHIGDGEASRIQLQGVQHDLDFPRVARLNLDGPRAGHPRKRGPDDIERVIVQIGRRNVARECEHEDRKHRRRQALDGELGVGRKVAADLRHPVLQLLQGHDHIGRRIELSGNLRGASDALRAHTPDAGHFERRLFERPRHDEHHRP